ncbi:MAG: VWA domain-containing protein [Phycisphaeraceae bacterium]|nr:VWA domain-containing protein [Phycisphaeraceae bacterium]
MKVLTKFIQFNSRLERKVRQSRHDSGAMESATSAKCSDTTTRVVVLIVDHSVSMGWTDYPPSRLQAAIDAATEYVSTLAKQSQNAHVAVVCFSDRAQLVVSLTPIRHHRKIIKEMRSIRVQGGTDIATGLKLATKVLAEHAIKDAQVQLVLLTDGHGGNPVADSDKAKRKYNAIIDVVGIGGAPKDVNEPLLRAVATTDPDGGSHYHFVRDAHALKHHYRQLATGLVWKGTDR